MSGQDRRRFFRIDDRLHLRLSRVLAGESVEAAPRDNEVMQEIDRRLKVLINAARLQAPAVAELAELLNRKLDHVVQTLELSEELAQRAAFREHTVNLSASGIALSTAEIYESGEMLALEMLLPPNATNFALRARVVKSTPRDGGGCDLKLDFAGIRPEDQEFLVQYILRRQGQFLQRMREEREQPPGLHSAAANPERSK
ncbi:MAG: PilZ domain-containing protein [Gammaproteobacteria bacterium]